MHLGTRILLSQMHQCSLIQILVGNASLAHEDAFFIYIWIGNASQAFCPHEWPLVTEIFHSQLPHLSKMHLGTRILMSQMHQCSLIQTAKMHHAKIFNW